jgi:hypothetical protein
MAQDQQNQNQSQTKIQTAKATVARGRSVDVPIPGKTVVVGTTGDNKPVTRAVSKHFTAGMEVELPLDEIKALRKSGYLVDPNSAPPPASEGPSFTSDAGPQTRAA